jgi:hypothetical protein
MIRNRKENLRSAKEEIQKELYANLDQLLAKRDMLVDRMDSEDDKDSLAESLRVLEAKISVAHQDISNWKLSKKSKAKKSIKWVDERTKKETRVSARPRKEINWALASEVSNHNRSIRKNNSSWLEEGVMVVHKDDKALKNPMMVIDVYDKGKYSRVLREGEVTVFRSLSLRPFDED